MKTKHPDVTVQLSGEDGNVYAIIGRVSGALRRAGYREDADAFQKAAVTCHSYGEVLQLCMAAVDAR